MILYDAPAFRQMAEDEGKAPVRLVFGSLQLPAAKDNRGKTSLMRADLRDITACEQLIDSLIFDTAFDKR